MVLISSPYRRLSTFNIQYPLTVTHIIVPLPFIGFIQTPAPSDHLPDVVSREKRGGLVPVKIHWNHQLPYSLRSLDTTTPGPLLCNVTNFSWLNTLFSHKGVVSVKLVATVQVH